MKKLLFCVSIAMAIGSTAFAQNSNVSDVSDGEAYTIVGNVFPEYQGKIYLAHQGERGLVRVDSTIVENGRYTFKGVVKYPKLYLIQANKQYQDRVTPFILEKGTIRISTKAPNLFYNSVVGGTIDNAIFYAFAQQNYYSTTDSMKYAYSIETLLAKQRGEDITKDAAAFKRRSKIGTERSRHWQQVYFNKYKDQFFGLFLLRTNMGYRMSPAQLEAAMKSISPKFKDHPYMKDLEQLLKSKEVIPGYPAPEFKVKDIDGNLISLAQFRGKIVLLDFWASWCGPCRRELPNVKEVFKKYGDRIVIIGVSLDNDEKAWKGAIKALGLTWHQVCDLKGWNGDIPVLYNVQSIPKAFLIDQKGVIRYVDLRGEALGEKVQELLNNSAK